MRKTDQSESPKKIAVLGSFPPLRALSSYCLEFALSIADLGKVEFISFRRIYPLSIYPGRDLEDDETFPVVRHTNLNIKRRLTWYNPITWVAEGLFTKADLLHAQWWSLPLWLIYLVVCAGFKLRGKPVIFTVHNVLPHEWLFFHLLLSRLLLKLGDHFIVHSGSNRAQLIRYFGILPERVSQVPHGPLDFHVRGDADRKVVRKEMGLGPEDKVILLFGAIRPYKGIDTALRAFAQVLREIEEARLLIAGKLWEEWDPYERLIDALGIHDHIIAHFGYVSSADVEKFFVASDLVLLPYHHFDSQSGVGAIAVSFRKPMIVTDVGGLPEFVEDRRYVVPPKDASALARAIVDSLKDPSQLEAMSKSAQAVATKFAWPAIAQRTWALYREVLRVSPRREEERGQ